MTIKEALEIAENRSMMWQDIGHSKYFDAIVCLADEVRRLRSRNDELYRKIASFTGNS